MINHMDYWRISTSPRLPKLYCNTVALWGGI